MAGTGIQDQVNLSLVKPVAGSVLAPGIFTNLKADSDSFDLIDDITDWNDLFAPLQMRCFSWRPGVKPTRFIMDAVASEVLLERNAENVFVINDTYAVVGGAVHSDRQSDTNNKSITFLPYFQKFFERLFRNPLTQEKVLRSISDNAHFRKAEDVHAGGPGFANRLQYSSGIV